MPGPVLGTENVMVRNSNNVLVLLDLRITQGRQKIGKKKTPKPNLLQISPCYEKETGYCMLLKDIKLYPQVVQPYTNLPVTMKSVVK